jgi:hypothetical protein
MMPQRARGASTSVRWFSAVGATALPRDEHSPHDRQSTRVEARILRTPEVVDVRALPCLQDVRDAGVARRAVSFVGGADEELSERTRSVYSS